MTQAQPHAAEPRSSVRATDEADADGARVAPERRPEGVLARLPARPAYAIAAAMGRRRFRRARSLLAAAIADVPTGLGLDADQLADVARRSFELAACERLDYANFERLTVADLPHDLELRGLTRLRTILDAGHGAILYSGHVRGHYLLFAALGLLGLKPNIVGMPIDRARGGPEVAIYERNERLLRERFGCRFLFMAESDFAVAARAANALRRGEVVTVEIDHTHSGRNVETTFLGRRARFPLGPLLLARSVGAPLVPFWLYRPKRRVPTIAELGEPITVGDDIASSLRRCLEPIESSIRAHPESWSTWLFPERNLWIDP